MTIDVRQPELEEMVDRAAELEVVAEGFDFIEGPVWREPGGYLLFSDVAMDVIYQWSEASGTSEFRRPSHKSNGLAFDSAGRLLACEHVTSLVSRTDQDGSVVAVATRWNGRGLNSPNDIAVARTGAIYFTDPPDGRISERWGLMRPREIDFQGIYLARPGNPDAILMADDFTFPNGICLSPDEQTLYVNDTRRMQVRAFAVLGDGRLADERVFLEQPGTGEFMDGAPDGMACDERGNLWATGPHGVWVVDPTGHLLGVVHTPKFASNVCFGGPDWADLYITCTDTVCRLPTRTRSARDAHVIQGDLERIARGLQERLGCSRVTIRVDDVTGETFPVKAEAFAPGVTSIAAHRTEGIRESETFRWIERERRVLVQNDVASSPITPAPVLLGLYGVRAQMLAPVLVDKGVGAIISIHQTGSSREWRDEEVAVAAAAAESVTSALGA